MTKIQNLEERLYIEKNKIGLVGGSISVIEIEGFDKDIQAHITPDDWRVEIKIKKGFDPVSDRRQKAYARGKKITNPVEKLVTDVTDHEFAHWELPFGSERGCPNDVYWHDKILEAVKESLPADKKSHAKYVTNAFEDMIINPRVREFRGDFSGQVLFWDNEGIRGKREGLETYTPFYEAFVKLNMHLFGDKKDKALLKRHYSGKDEVQKAVAQTVKDLSLPEDIKDTKPLFNRKNWASMASSFARNLAPLLQDNQDSNERLSAYGNPQDGEGNSGNGLEEKAKTDGGKEEISYGRYSGREKLSPNVTDFEQLDALYRVLARDITVKVDAMTRGQSLDICALNFRPFDAETDDPAGIKLSKFYITEDGLKFGYQREPLTISARQKFQRSSFPDFKMIVLDNSGSMEEPISGSNQGNNQTIPWGDNSKYHYALLGFYGIENFLQRQGIAQWINHGVSLFSDSTRMKTGDFSQIDSIRKHALHPDFQNTYIDANSILNALNGKESFVLSLSDGSIANWGSEKTRFENLVKGNYYAHIQIGGETEFSRDLQSMGVPVFYVNSGDDLSRLMVDVTKKTYDCFTKTT